jgi:predicted Zn finger-like uncharacterized protein
MSLATKCPHCHTTFKVANDQLKLQAGLVRCGICQQIFNGIDYLVDVNAEVKSVHIETPAPVVVNENSNVELQHVVEQQEPEIVISEPLVLEPPIPESPVPEPLIPEPPVPELLIPEPQKEELQNPAYQNLTQPSPTQQNSTTQNPAYLSANLETLPFSNLGDVEEIVLSKSGIDDAEFDKEMLAEEAKNLAKSAQMDKSVRHTTYTYQPDLPAAHISDHVEPSAPISHSNEKEPETNEAQVHVHALDQLSFVRQASTNKRYKRLFSIGTVVLSILLVGQATYLLRNYTAALFPSTQQFLVTLCKYAHCQINLLTQADALSYEAAELHTLPRANTFEFGLLIRNHSAFTQAWPHIELTLQNAQKQTVLRRIFSPSEYLTKSDDIARGFASHQEYVVQVYFEVDQVKASDFVAEIFYP